MSDWYQGKVNESLVRLELERRRADLAARVEVAWQLYNLHAGGNLGLQDKLYPAYRSLADELEQATGFAVTCGALTGRPA